MSERKTENQAEKERLATDSVTEDLIITILATPNSFSKPIVFWHDFITASRVDRRMMRRQKEKTHVWTTNLFVGFVMSSIAVLSRAKPSAQISAQQ